MSINRGEKIANQIKQLSATYIERITGLTSLITVTRVEISQDNKNATIMVSVIPKEKENAAYGFIRRNLGDIRKSVAKGLKINPIPYLKVAIDEGEKNRQKIDELLKNR